MRECVVKKKILFSGNIIIENVFGKKRGKNVLKILMGQTMVKGLSRAAWNKKLLCLSKFEFSFMMYLNDCSKKRCFERNNLLYTVHTQ